ncbi:MAG: MotA/TolQ/ExbB proton channel family protein [Rhodothermaceae bacterium]
MEILSNLETLLYILSTAFFYPVIIGLILLTFWMVISLGSFFRDYMDRKKYPAGVINIYKSKMQQLMEETNNGAVKNLDIFLEQLLQNTEQQLLKSVKRVSFAIRVAPSLGLMGTLIPMGVALSSLAQGDMPAMAGNMVTAFTTTIVGLACGVVAYLISLIREKWINEDIRNLEYETELFLRENVQLTNTINADASASIIQETNLKV